MTKVGEDYFKDKNDDFSSGGSGYSQKASSSTRTLLIEEIFLQVLGRKPSSRELSYYKYSMISESEIKEKLLFSAEHEKIIQNASKLHGVQKELSLMQLNSKKLIQRVEDVENQLVESNILLNEKNRVIRELREEKHHPYDFVNNMERYEEGFDIYNTVRRKEEKIEKKRSFIERLLDFFSILFD